MPTVKQCKLNCWAVIITQRAVDEERHSTKHLPPSRAAPSIASPSSVMSDSPIRLANCVWQSHRINNTSPGVFFITGSITAKPVSVSKLALQLLLSPHHRPVAARFAYDRRKFTLLVLLRILRVLLSFFYLLFLPHKLLLYFNFHSLFRRQPIEQSSNPIL